MEFTNIGKILFIFNSVHCATVPFFSQIANQSVFKQREGNPVSLCSCMDELQAATSRPRVGQPDVP